MAANTGDNSYHAMAEAIAQRENSGDPEFQVGACVEDENGRIIGEGANNMPKDLNNKFPWRKGAGLHNKHLYVCHAELNAIAMAIREEGSVADCKLYCTLHPCNECAKVIVQMGIKEVIYLSDEKGHKDEFIAGKKILNNAEVERRPIFDSSTSDEDYIRGATIMLSLRNNAMAQGEYSEDPEFPAGAYVEDENGNIIGEGDNNMPQDLNNEFPWGNGGGLDNKHLYVCHAELNAIAFAIRGGRRVADCKLHCTLHPCNECAKVIVQLGIKEVIYLSNEKGHKVEYKAAAIIFERTGVVCRQLLDEDRFYH